MAIFSELKQNAQTKLHPVLEAFQNEASKLLQPDPQKTITDTHIKLARGLANKAPVTIPNSPLDGLPILNAARQIGFVGNGQYRNPEMMQMLQNPSQNMEAIKGYGMDFLQNTALGMTAAPNEYSAMRDSLDNIPLEELKRMSHNPKPLKMLQREMDVEAASKVPEGFINENVISDAYNKVFSNRY